MEELKESVKKVVTEELERANTKFPMFRSAHEGYAVIKEEQEEASNEMRLTSCCVGELWDEVKHNDTVASVEEAYKLKDTSILLASEAIQVAAMAQKFIDSFKEDEKDE